MRKGISTAFLFTCLIGAAVIIMGCMDAPATPPTTPAASPPALTLTPTPEPTPANIARTDARRTGTATPASAPTAVPSPTAVPAPTPTRVIPHTQRPRPTEPFPTATATPSPFASLEVDIGRETLWRDLLDDLYPHERACIEVEGEPDGLDLPILVHGQYYTLEHEVAMFACLEPGTARAVFLGAMVADFEQDDGVEIPENEVACIRDMLTGMDAAAVVAAMAFDAEDPLIAGEFMAGFYRCIPEGVVSVGAIGSTPESIGNRIDCAREVLEVVNAEIMIALMREEETPEAERFFLALMDCIYVGYGDIEDDHADRIADATVTQAGHTLAAAVDYYNDVDFFAFVAEEGTIYQVGVGLGTLEEVTISLYGPYPEYDELHSASSHENGQTTSIFWQSSITDMVFVSVHGGEGTGDYSFLRPARETA